MARRSSGNKKAVAKLEVAGIKEAQRALRKLGSKSLTKKVSRNAVSTAATIIVKAARRRAPVSSGLLKKSIAKKVYSKGWDHNAIVGVDKAAQGTYPDGRRYVPSNVDHLIEYGFVHRDGQHVPAQPFLRPAADEALPQARRHYVQKVRSNIKKEVAKLAKQGKRAAARARKQSVRRALGRTGGRVRGHGVGRAIRAGKLRPPRG